MSWYFHSKCNEYDDGNEVQQMTHWDEWANNDYNIDDEYLEDGTIKIIPTEKFLKVVGEDEPKPENIEYCALNTDENLLFAYDTDGIHWFYVEG